MPVAEYDIVKIRKVKKNNGWKSNIYLDRNVIVRVKSRDISDIQSLTTRSYVTSL